MTENIIFKVMPIEGHALSSVEAAMILLETLNERKISARDTIGKIAIRINAAADMIINKAGPLCNTADRDHCLQYIVALTSLEGSVPEAGDFLDTSKWATDDSLHELRDKIEISVDEQLTKDYMNLEVKSLAAGMVVHFTDGTSLEEVLVHLPAGHGKNFATQRLVREKYRRNMRLMSSEDEIDVISCNVLDGEQGNQSVSDFLALLVRGKTWEAKL